MLTRLHFEILAAQTEIATLHQFCLAHERGRGKEKELHHLFNQVARLHEAIDLCEEAVESDASAIFVLNRGNRFQKQHDHAMNLLAKARHLQKEIITEFLKPSHTFPGVKVILIEVLLTLELMNLYEYTLNRSPNLTAYPGNLNDDSKQIHTWMELFKKNQNEMAAYRDLDLSAELQEIRTELNEVTTDKFFTRIKPTDEDIQNLLSAYASDMKTCYAKLYRLMGIANDVKYLQPEIRTVVKRASFNPEQTKPTTEPMKKSERVSTSDAKQPKYGSFKKTTTSGSTPRLFSPTRPPAELLRDLKKNPGSRLVYNKAQKEWRLELKKEEKRNTAASKR